MTAANAAKSLAENRMQGAIMSECMTNWLSSITEKLKLIPQLSQKQNLVSIKTSPTVLNRIHPQQKTTPCVRCFTNIAILNMVMMSNLKFGKYWPVKPVL